MSSNLHALDQQIAELKADAVTAEQAHASASVELASNPGDEKTRMRARAASSRLADLNGELKMLLDARAYAEADSRSEAAKARRQQAAEYLKQARHLAGTRNTAGEQVDQALAALKKALDEWQEANAELAPVVADFYRTAMPNSPRVSDLFFGIGRDLPGAALNALSCQLEEATHGLPSHGTLHFNFIRKKADEPELVARDAEISGARIISGMEQRAQAEGIVP